MPEKRFKIDSSEIKPLAEGHGGCYATDMVTVEGQKVGYMYREKPDFPEDSGWRFFSGKESQDYLEDAGHTAIYDVNTIANYDTAIISLLDAPIGSAFERRGWFEKFVAVPFEPPDEEKA
ncbi:MAG: DUF2185 domain-containing protein [Verrucomicrobia bacterium]|nr:DUF2185 domain-containing protein [Verrucomicrobiota bacterium]